MICFRNVSPQPTDTTSELVSMPPIAYLDQLSSSSIEVAKDNKSLIQLESDDESSLDMSPMERRVWFSDEPDMQYEIEMVPEGDKPLIWYCKEEFTFIEKRNSLIVQLVQAGVFTETDKFTARGLEPWIELREDTYDAIHAVFKEQTRQAKSDINRRRRRVARESRRASRVHREIALRAGIADAKIAWGVEGREHSEPGIFPVDETTGRIEDDAVVLKEVLPPTRPMKIRSKVIAFASPAKRMKPRVKAVNHSSPAKRSNMCTAQREHFMARKTSAIVRSLSASPERCSPSRRVRNVNGYGGLPTLAL